MIGSVTAHLNPMDLIRPLSGGDLACVVKNSVLAGGATAIGYGVVAAFEKGVSKITNNQTMHTLVAFPLGVVGSLLITSCLPLPVQLEADKVVRIIALALGAALCVPKKIILSSEIESVASLFIPLGAFVGCFSESSLYVCGTVGAAFGAGLLSKYPELTWRQV